MGLKRQYSRHNMTIKSEDGDSPPGIHKKRRKNDSSVDQPLVDMAKKNKATRPFSGPVSLPIDEDGDINMVDAGAQHRELAVSKRHAKTGGTGIVTKPQPNIHGSRRNFDQWVAEQRKTTNGKKTNPIPKPISNVKKIESANGPNRYSNHRGFAAKPATSVPIPGSTGRSTSSQDSGKATKQPYVPKTNGMTKSPVCRKNILGKRIELYSPQAQLWELNQDASPLLRLPGEIRNRIYEFVLGRKTISIEYKTYDVTEVDGATRVRPCFKYLCHIVNGRTNPFALHQAKAVLDSVTNGMTLLNSVCRQLYQETAVLPYKLNRWSFDSHNTLFNFVAMERKISRASASSIIEVIVRDAVPQANLLGYMTGLERVMVSSTFSRGWYKVVRDDKGAKLVKEGG